MKVIIIGGFLGSGKTRVIMHIIEYLKKIIPNKPNNVVIIENEVGSVGVDDKALSDAGYRIENMLSGCACCSLSGQLVSSLKRLYDDLNPQYVILEATGMAVPGSIKESITSELGWPARIVCVTDARRWERLSRCLVSDLLHNQLREADVIAINKIDSATEEQVAQTEKSVRDFNKAAQIIKLAASQTELDDSCIESIIGT